jgi:hypothetical protein
LSVESKAQITEFDSRDIFLCGNRDIILDIEKYAFTVIGIIFLLPIIFSCYYQAFTFQLELIGIGFLKENELITISVVLSNSHDNYRLNWNDLDGN